VLTVVVAVGFAGGLGVAIADTEGDTTPADDVERHGSLGEFTAEQVDPDRGQSENETVGVEKTERLAAQTQTAAPWPGQTGGPDGWVSYTDSAGFTIRNAVTGQNLKWIRMSSGEPATKARGTLPTVQLASDGSNAFFRLRTTG
jgi:hypothetical protein